MSGALEIQSWIKRHGRVLAGVLGERSTEGPLKVKTIASGERSLVFALTAGARQILVKAFDPDWDEAPQALQREAACLARLGPAGHAPALRGVSKESCFFASDYVMGGTVAEDLSDDNLTIRASELGRWFAKSAAVMPKRTVATTNWLGYLDRYEAVLTENKRDRHHDMLATLPIELTVISKNDGFLGNFIISETGGLVGIDFESATYKPMGWDILITARVLARRFPDRIEEIAAALVAGWGQGTDRINQAEFERLVVCFALLTAFKDS